MTNLPNPFLLAADNSPTLLPLLRETPAIASQQDEHGYSLLHAAASYNHLELLRVLVRELHVDVNITDEDDETPLFVVETVEAAKVLVEELSANTQHRGQEGLTAAEKIDTEGDFPTVAAYLKSIASPNDNAIEPASSSVPRADLSDPPKIEGLNFTMGTIDQAEDVPNEVDTEFRRRIEELAQRADFDTPAGQADLRKLVEDAIMDQGIGEERNVRPKHA
ncbi:hypothetical protein HIM_07265 [Hirsutella minnesotensis 3608]|uniref:Uncharacterized protein n=1 Tax=Hirsutella minnesotensis 3608 TaxID=1043627 RepID=A0A0F7ZHZ0_9HYPO|nr:hypothetical protein HIM_07265 [Hirsutella minnesotensis 3608]